jgi:hypothetical protein
MLSDEGARVYNREIASSDRLQRSQALVLATCGPDVVTLPLALRWDGVRFLWLYEFCAVNVPTFYNDLYNYFTTICANLVPSIVQIL